MSSYFVDVNTLRYARLIWVCRYSSNLEVLEMMVNKSGARNLLYLLKSVKLEVVVEEHIFAACEGHEGGTMSHIFLWRLG